MSQSRNNIRDKLILTADDHRRHAADMKRQGFHQRAAEARAAAKAFEAVLNWIDNGLPLHPPKTGANP